MNTRIFLIAIVFTASLFFTSCDKDNEPSKPEITILELGEGDSHGNDHTAVIGGELHMEIELVAEGTIDLIQVIIHPQGEHHEKAGNDDWEIDTTYTKFSGLKNTLFHEHVVIDSIAEAGEYHFDFIVTDMEGYQSSAEAEIEIIEE